MGMIKAVILAAGRGERLWPLTTTRPKPLLPILCKPLIYRHLEAIARHGVRDAVIVFREWRDDWVKIVKEYAKNIGLNIEFVEQNKPLGTGHAVKVALDKIVSEGGCDSLLILYGDLFILENAYNELLSDILGRSSNALATYMVDDVSMYGEVLVEDGVVRDIVEKPERAGGGFINAGVYKLDLDDLCKAFNNMKLSPRGEFEFTDQVKAIASKSTVEAVTIRRGCWRDIGTPWEYLEANIDALKEYSRRVGREVIVSDKAVIKDPVVLEGPCYIDDMAELGPVTHIRPYTIVCRGAKVGFASQVKASVVLEGAKIPHLNYVGDSIIGEHSNLGAGTITANLRHDNKPVKTVIKGRLVSTGRRKFGTVIGGYAKTGINTSIMPGVKIGAYAWIGGGCILYRDVPDYALVKCSQEIKCREEFVLDKVGKV